MADLLLVSSGASIVFSIVVVLAYIPTSSARSFIFFPASSPTFVVGGVLDSSYSNGSEMKSYHGFDLHFLYGQRW
jgi:hypothetical protein